MLGDSIWIAESDQVQFAVLGMSFPMMCGIHSTTDIAVSDVCSGNLLLGADQRSGHRRPRFCILHRDGHILDIGSIGGADYFARNTRTREPCSQLAVAL